MIPEEDAYEDALPREVEGLPLRIEPARDLQVAGRTGPRHHETPRSVKIGAMDTWERLDTERAALYDDLAGLNSAQWDEQSLCREWKVRHVVAHLIAGTQVKPRKFLVQMIRSGLSFDRAIAKEALDAGAAPPDVLLAAFKAVIGNRSTPPGAKPVTMLSDSFCHAVDIRRPLGLSRAVPEATMREVADYVRGIGTPLGAKKRIAGLRLAATDVAWSTGDGPSVEGPLLSLILAMGGRRSVLADLNGEGLATLQSRV